MPLQVVNGAELACTFGDSPSSLVVLPVNRSQTSDQPEATIQDHIPMLNIMPFGMCASLSNPQVAAATTAAEGVLTPQPCIPVTPSPWTPGAATVQIADLIALDDVSVCNCTWGGVISITDAGEETVQIPSVEAATGAEMFTTIIDADGLPGAVAYYTTYPNEPSPLGMIDCDPHAINAMRNASLLGLLNAAAASTNVDLLVICHAFVPGGEGLFLPLVPGSGLHASTDALKRLMKTDRFVSQAGTIQNAPQGTQAERNAKLQQWSQFFDSLNQSDVGASVSIGGSFTLDEARAAWTQALTSIAGTLRLTVAQLNSLLQARRTCLGRAAKLQRLEFRACDLGSKPATLQVMKDYFGAGKVTAPKLETMFHAGPRAVALNFWRGPLLLGMGRPPWVALLPLPFWLGKVGNPLTDADHRAAVHQQANFDVATMIPEFETRELTNPRALGGGGRRTPADIAANGAHKQVWLGVALFIWKYDQAHFLYDAVLAVMFDPTQAPHTPRPHRPPGPSLVLLDEFYTNKINRRGTHGIALPRIAGGLRAPPLAALWNPTSGTDLFFLPLEAGYVAQIVSV